MIFRVCVKGRLEEDRFVILSLTGPADTGMYAAAIDIGTTTVSAVLAELPGGKIVAKGSGGNGQIRYGADVINRIIEQGKPGGRKKLQDAIGKETLVPLLANLCRTAGISARSIFAALRGCQYHHESPVCGCGRRSGADGAVYSLLLLLAGAV